MSLSIPQSGETTRHELTRKPGSIASATQRKITFKELWANYPPKKENGKSATPCQSELGVANFENQCAVRMGVCLNNLGINFTSNDGLMDCKKAFNIKGHKPLEHIIRAEELANWLDKHAIAGIKKAVKYKPDTFYKAIHGKTGIIFFLNYYGRQGQIDGGGDHIDLWNKNKTTQDSFEDYGQTLWGLAMQFKYGRADEIWFWAVE